MKRSYLIEASDRIQDYHQQGDKFQIFIEETIRQLEQVVRTAQEEIAHFNKLRQAVNLTVANESILARKLPATETPKLPAISDKLEAEISASLEDNIREMVPPVKVAKQN